MLNNGIPLKQESANFLKGQIVVNKDILDFMGQMVFVTTIQFFHSNISCRCVIIVNSMEIASFEQFTRINMSPFSPVFSEAPEL